MPLNKLLAMGEGVDRTYPNSAEEDQDTHDEEAHGCRAFPSLHPQRTDASPEVGQVRSCMVEKISIIPVASSA